MMTVNLAGGCRVSEMREGEPLIHGTLRLWRHISRASGAQAISLRVMEFAPGLSPGIRNDDCDEILYVIGDCQSQNPSDSRINSRQSDDEDIRQEQARGPRRGSPAGVEVRSAPSLDHVSFNASHPEAAPGCNQTAVIVIDSDAYEVSDDTGIYIHPSQTFAIDNRGSNSILVISAQCPDPDRPLHLVDAPLVLADCERSDRQPFVRLADRPAQPTADRWYRVLVDDEIGSTQVTQFVGSIPPGRAPDHFHNYEEVLFILKGEGRMWAGETNTPIAPGSCIYLPKRQVHCVENTGEGELRLLGIFYPAGSPSVRYEA
jgi:mannose-6-phosphate isomerase-like protein (cupin superfamily)